LHLNNLGPPPPDSDEEEPPFFDSDEEDPPSDDEDDPNITLESMITNVQFVRMVEDATLEAQFGPAELRAFRNPQELRFSPVEDPDLRLSIGFFIATLDHNESQKSYATACELVRIRWPESKMLSYDQVKRRGSNLSGVVTWKGDMCVDSCAAFTGPFAHLEQCPRCGKSRYDEEELRKSHGKKKVPQKVFTTFPLGPQIQSRWKSPEMAQKMFYRRDKTRDLLRKRNRGEGYVYDDIFCGSDYLDAVENGEIKDYDTVVMLSIDGARSTATKNRTAGFISGSFWILRPTTVTKYAISFLAVSSPVQKTPNTSTLSSSQAWRTSPPFRRKACISGTATIAWK
jgi:hypothetical protein